MTWSDDAHAGAFHDAADDRSVRRNLVGVLRRNGAHHPEAHVEHGEQVLVGEVGRAPEPAEDRLLGPAPSPELGAEVTGLGLDPITKPQLFSRAKIGREIHTVIGDIRDAALTRDVVAQAAPTVIFHLAAQPLVSRAFEDPLETFEIGRAHV